MAESELIYTTMDSFLASIDKRAYIMAKMAIHDADAALDIVQDAMLQMVKSYRNKPADQWPPLFFGILNNRITDHHRKRGIFGKMSRWFGKTSDEDDFLNEDAIDQLDSKQPAPDQELHASQLGELMQEHIENLPLRQQQAVTLRLWQGLSVEETAQAMGVSTGSVKTHLHRALQALRSELHEYKSA